MRSSLVSLGRRLPELTSDLALLADLVEAGAPDALDKARAIIDKAVCAICKEEGIAIDGYTTVDAMIRQLVVTNVVPSTLAAQVLAVHGREVALPGDAVHAIVGFLEFRVGSRAHLSDQPKRKRPSWMVPALVAAIVVVGVAIAYVAWPRDPARDLVGAPMVGIAGATFEMGSREDELAGALAMCRDIEHRDDCQLDNEQLAQEQLRTVTIAPFELDVHEVTIADYVAWLATQPGPAIEGVVVPPNVDYDRERHTFGVRPERANLPITGINWESPRAYCEAVRKRLPTEAEWELAARGRERRTFPWGSDPPRCTDVVFSRAHRRPCVDAGPPDPVAVATARGDITPDGVRDLGGNVAEWTADAGASRPRCSGPCVNPRIDGAGGRVVRGGNWSGRMSRMRGAARTTLDPVTTRTTLGFRCAR